MGSLTAVVPVRTHRLFVTLVIQFVFVWMGGMAEQLTILSVHATGAGEPTHLRKDLLQDPHGDVGTKAMLWY